MNKQYRNKIIGTQEILTVARWEGGLGMGEKVKGLRSTIGLLQNSLGDVIVMERQYSQ